MLKSQFPSRGISYHPVWLAGLVRRWDDKPNFQTRYHILFLKVNCLLRWFPKGYDTSCYLHEWVLQEMEALEKIQASLDPTQWGCESIQVLP